MIVKESIDGIKWSGQDVTKAEIIGTLITRPLKWGNHTIPSEEYNIVEIVDAKNGKIYIADKWYKHGVPQIIHDELVKEYRPLVSGLVV